MVRLYYKSNFNIIKVVLMNMKILKKIFKKKIIIAIIIIIMVVFIGYKIFGGNGGPEYALEAASYRTVVKEISETGMIKISEQADLGFKNSGKMNDLYVKVGDKVVENIKKELTETRKRIRGSDSPSFSVLSSEKVAGIVNDIMNMIQLAIFGFASIAIVVGAIGIMNTMYTSVHERIKEIGIMKAVGAKRNTITLIFLIESGFFGLFGGIGGIILGLGMAKGAELAIKTTGAFYLKASMSPWLILFGLVFSFLIGCIAGYLPARSAAKLRPVDALRYE